MHLLASSSRRRRALLVGSILLGSAGCQKEETQPPVPHAITELKGTTSERVERMRGILRLTAELQATILDAHALEDRAGDGRLGPSDFSTFMSLRVAPGDLPLWRAELTPSIEEVAPAFVAPPSPAPWWVTPEDYTALQFFMPDKLTGFTNGWIGINKSTGMIYIYTFTT